MGSWGALELGLLLCAVCGAAGELHTLRYFQTAMTDPGPELPWFFEVGYVDGEIFVHYNSTTRRYVPRTEWIKAPGAVDPEYWERNTRIAQSNEQIHRATTRPASSFLRREKKQITCPVPAEGNHHGLWVISTRKSNAETKQDDSLNFGMKTLEEIKLKKQKDKRKQQSEGPSGVPAHPPQSRTVPVPEENMQTVVRAVTLSAKQGEEPVIRWNTAEKLGKRKSSVAWNCSWEAKQTVWSSQRTRVQLQLLPNQWPKRSS